ncbi:MAG: hypothetical protein EXS10_04905 [Phycisphaerales bacterium]|nr:hypothetical protein [Phycisphaerales bacterium]
MGTLAHSEQTIRIRKYPNRRLYDTTRSTHLTHDDVLRLVRSGHRVSISNSSTDADITNSVLLQILVARDPNAIAGIPSDMVFALCRAEATPACSLPTKAAGKCASTPVAGCCASEG